jgi:hypothetical protein
VEVPLVAQAELAVLQVLY